MEQVKKEVTIYQTEPFRLLPEGSKGEIKKNIGASWDRNTKSLKMGIDEKERQYLLPSIINISVNDPNWEKAVKGFFAELTIVVPPEGLSLNVATYKKDVMIQGKLTTVDFPYSPMDYIKWKQSIVNETVSPNKDGSKDGTKQFFIDDKESMRIRNIEERKSIEKIETEYLELVKTNDEGEYVNTKELRFITYVLGRNPDALDIDDQINLVRKMADESIKNIKEDGYKANETKFIKTVKDRTLRTRAMLMSLLSKNIIVKQGDYIVDGDNTELVLGRNIDEAISYMNNPAYSDRVAEYRRKLESTKVIIEV